MNSAWHTDMITRLQAGGVKDVWTGGQTDRWLMNVGEDSKGVRMGARMALGRMRREGHGQGEGMAMMTHYLPGRRRGAEDWDCC